MQFYDEVKIQISSGKGGDGLASGRREAGVPFGGPNGGDGGRGGDLVFEASKDENTLLPYRYRKIFKSEKGEDGRTRDQYGANGEDLTLIVPVGTLIKDEKGNILKHLTKNKEKWTALVGGEGGWGNIHFKDAVNQYPTFALLGEPGHQKEVTLELQLLADVALIGSPSVGKSSLINAISHTKAKVADYPFTTLVPNLGSIQVGDYNFNMIDIPGLIKGASEGKGLGNTFLRHILKARVFCFISDISRLDKGLDEVCDLFEEIITYIYKKIGTDLEISLNEEGNYIALIAKKDNEIVLNKKIVFAINKYDLINDEEVLQEYKGVLFKHLNKFLKKKLDFEISQKLEDKNCLTISAATHFGLENWTKHLVELLKNTTEYETVFENAITGEYKEYKVKMIEDITKVEKPKLLENGYLEEISSKYNKVWHIDSVDICKLTMITQWGNDEGELYFWKILEQRGLLSEFEKQGIKKGDVLKIKSYYENEADKFIMY